MAIDHIISRAIDSFVTEQMELGAAPGLALTILRDGEVICQRGYGYADMAARTPMTERTAVVIGSTTKALTCMALLQLADRGLLGLDDPVRRYIPAFRVAGEAASAHMTIRQAVTHTAGFPPSAADNPAFLFSDDDAPDALERYIATMATMRPLWAPGEGWVYANDGFVVAGRVIEIVSGQGYEEYMRRNLFMPLGLEDAAFSRTETLGLAVATPYDYDADGQPYPSFFPHNRAAAAAGSQLLMSVRDGGRWLRTILNGGRSNGELIVSARGCAELIRPQVAMPAATRGLDASEAWYGLGWMIGMLNGVSTISHSGATITMGSQFILAPAERLAVAVVANSVSDVTSIIGEGVMSLALGRQPCRSFPRVDRARQQDRTLWPRLVGTYQALTRQNKVTGPWRVELVDGRLCVRTYPGDERRRPGDIFLYPLAPTRFVLFGRGRTGGIVDFEVNGETVRGVWEGVPIECTTPGPEPE